MIVEVVWKDDGAEGRWRQTDGQEKRKENIEFAMQKQRCESLMDEQGCVCCFYADLYMHINISGY